MKKILFATLAARAITMGYAATPYADAKAAETSNASSHMQAFSNQALFDALEKDGHNINDIFT